MPLLPLEPYVFPSDLLKPADTTKNGIKVEGPDTRVWWAVHTKPRAEKALARKFHGAGLHFFLPLGKKEWQSRGRLLSSFVPLFPGYIFLCGDDQARLEALQTNQVARLIPVTDGPQLINDLIRVHRMMQADLTLTPEERLQPGMPVRIVEGPLMGMEGKIIQRGRRLCFIVEVHFLQRGVSVEIDAKVIRPLEERTTPLG
jgi:transcriptional antiterminator RfaH